MTVDQLSTSRVQISIDLSHKGRQIGDLRARWSDNHVPGGYYLTPIASLSRGEGPTLLITGGVHGDEFEGPAALMRLLNDLDITHINGRIIIIPALNAPAIAESSRVSSIDGLNMNRAFPGDPDGSPVQMIAHYVEAELLPQCDAAIDLHSGGKASVFVTCALADVDPESPSGSANLALVKAFAAPYLWVAGPGNDDRSLNAAAARQKVPMIAAELGGGGSCNPDETDFAEAAIRRCLSHLEILPKHGDIPTPRITPLAVKETFIAPASGLFDRKFKVGDKVEKGQSAGWIHFIHEPERPSLPLVFGRCGTVLAVSNRGMLERGDLIAIIAEHCQIRDL
ncbi:MAG: succinylglutamate desuccinylase [Gammaproteobacteria bacterium]|nr:succinylglutamate desuccinylase [Gammaproteobacteria bacterium]